MPLPVVEFRGWAFREFAVLECEVPEWRPGAALDEWPEPRRRLDAPERYVAHRVDARLRAPGHPRLNRVSPDAVHLDVFEQQVLGKGRLSPEVWMERLVRARKCMKFLLIA